MDWAKGYFVVNVRYGYDDPEPEFLQRFVRPAKFFALATFPGVHPEMSIPPDAWHAICGMTGREHDAIILEGPIRTENILVCETYEGSGKFTPTLCGKDPTHTQVVGVFWAIRNTEPLPHGWTERNGWAVKK